MTHDETARMAQSLRAMANRTGNAAAESAMRDAAQYLDALNIQYTRLAEECDKLRAKLADKDEQLAGWKRLVDSIGAPARPHNKVPAHARSRRRAFDYAAAIRNLWTATWTLPQYRRWLHATRTATCSAKWHRLRRMSWSKRLEEWVHRSPQESPETTSSSSGRTGGLRHDLRQE